MKKKHIFSACLSVIFVAVFSLCILQYSGYDIVDKLGIDTTKGMGAFLSDNGLLGKKPQPEETVNQEFDLDKAFKIITEKGTKDLYESYPVDLSFLCWVEKTYGNSVIVDIAYQLYEGRADADTWYELTGNSMHVLWLLYCQDMGYATYNLENVYWKDCASKDKVTIDFTGDINLADDWLTMQAANASTNGINDCISKDVVKELQSADISVINNEFVFSDTGTALAGKAYTFRANTKNVAHLKLFGADLANLANNHVYDFAAEGLQNTIKTLKNAGIVSMGAGENIHEAKAIKYFVANGRKIAFVSATEIERFSNFTKEATETEAGVLKTLDPTIYNQVIATAKKNSDYVIAIVHWGTEGTYTYVASQQTLAQGFVEAGADVVIGGHPHRMQGIEYMDGVPIVYSLGNFWFSNGTLYTTIAQVEIDASGELGLKFIPCIQKDLKVSKLTDEESVAFYKFVADISTEIAIDTNGYIYNIKDGANADKIVDSYYVSGQNYATYKQDVDLDNRPIDIIGNLK